LLTVLQKEKKMDEEYTVIRQEIESLAYILWKKDEDLSDEIQELIDGIMEKIKDI
tara:strand:- start:177 stop:341 length:165 start_codon:yes stop_codon:yes gene_type:complete